MMIGLKKKEKKTENARAIKSLKKSRAQTAEESRAEEEAVNNATAKVQIRRKRMRTEEELGPVVLQEKQPVFAFKDARTEESAPAPMRMEPFSVREEEPEVIAVAPAASKDSVVDDAKYVLDENGKLVLVPVTPEPVPAPEPQEQFWAEQSQEPEQGPFWAEPEPFVPEPEPFVPAGHRRRVERDLLSTLVSAQQQFIASTSRIERAKIVFEDEEIEQASQQLVTGEILLANARVYDSAGRPREWNSIFEVPLACNEVVELDFGVCFELPAGYGVSLKANADLLDKFGLVVESDCLIDSVSAGFPITIKVRARKSTAYIAKFQRIVSAKVVKM